jgi:hypothetical protein
MKERFSGLIPISFLFLYYQTVKAKDHFPVGNLIKIQYEMILKGNLFI